MASYSDLTFNSGDYINQYAGIPLEQIQSTADTLSARHYQNIAQANQLEILANQYKSRLLPGARSYVDTHINSIQRALEEMAKTGGENATAKVSALANALQSDQGILTALQQSERVNKEIETENAIRAAGKRPVRREGVREAMLNAALINPETNELSELYKNPYQSSVEPYEEPVGQMEEIWKIVNPDSIEQAMRSAAGTSMANLLPGVVNQGNVDVPLFFENVTKAGISGQKIKNLLDEGWSSYQLTPAYRQQKDLLGKSDKQLQQEFYNHGLLRVFNNLSRDYKQAPALGAGSAETPLSPVINPLPAKVRSKLDLGFDADAIDDKGNIKPNWIEAILGDSGVKQEGAEYVDVMSPFQANIGIDNKAQKKEKQEKLISYMRTAMEVYGAGVTDPADPIGPGLTQDKVGESKLTDDQVKKFAGTAEGKAILQNYLTNIAGQRYHAPYINNVVDEKIRTANEDFLRGNFSQRQFIDMATGEHYTGLKDENGEVQEDLLELAKAMAEKKVILEGTVDPKHIFTDIDNAGENFARGIRIQVPLSDGSGQMKEYLVSQLPQTTSPQDINENILYKQATEVPGRWSSVGYGIEVLSPASQAQKEALWTKYGQSSGLMKDQFMSNDVVLINDNGTILPAKNYAAAAQWLAGNKGIKLKNPKKK